MEIVITGEPQVITRTIVFTGTLNEWETLQKDCASLYRESNLPINEGKFAFELLGKIAEA